MPDLTADEIANIYRKAQHSVAMINAQTSKQEYDVSDQQWKDRIKRNWQHLEIIKSTKKEDHTTSIWTTEDFTAIDAAIVKGKAVQS